jgi:hypothetical protein
MRLSILVRQLWCSLSAAILFACAVVPRVEAQQAKAFDFAELEAARRSQ